MFSHWPECLGETFVEARGEQVIAGMQPHRNSMRSYEKLSSWMLLNHCPLVSSRFVASRQLVKALVVER